MSGWSAPVFSTIPRIWERRVTRAAQRRWGRTRARLPVRGASRASSLTFAVPLRTRETVAIDTPLRRATSRMSAIGPHLLRGRPIVDLASGGAARAVPPEEFLERRSAQERRARELRELKRLVAGTRLRRAGRPSPTRIRREPAMTTVTGAVRLNRGPSPRDTRRRSPWPSAGGTPVLAVGRAPTPRPGGLHQSWASGYDAVGCHGPCPLRLGVDDEVRQLDSGDASTSAAYFSSVRCHVE